MNNTTSNLPPTPSPSSDPRPHAVVIGAGFGGLAAAVRLGARGYRVTVLEHRDAPGGRAYVYERDGFSFDGGPTVITAPFLFEELWELAGKKLSDDVEMRPVDPFYRIRFHDGQTFDYTGDAERMKAEVARFSPRDVEGYERFVQMSERIFRIGFQELAHVDFSSWWDMAKIVPDMMRLQSFKTVWSLVADHVKDDRLRQVLSFHPLLVGGNPFDTTSIYSLIAFLERQWGVHYPKGGTASLVRGLVKLVEGQGGSFRYGATVKRIRTEGRRATGVELENGEVFDAAVVVSNADSSETYRKLIDPESRSRWTDKKIERARHSMSLFVWYFGTDRKYEDVAHHTILLGPRYRGLLDDIFTNKVLAEDFSLYLHRPTATDTSIAPPGCEAFYVLSPVPNLEGKTDWASEAEPYRKRIESFLSKTVLPGLEGHIVSQHVSTPLYFRDTLLSYRGAAFGLEPVLTQSAYFRPHNKSEELDNLFLVGAGTHPGAGVPGVLSSARVLDRLVPDARR
jgi:phytoene desaturase